MWLGYWLTIFSPVAIFSEIKTGQEMILVYGDGSVQHFQASNIVDYQRLTPTDLKSNFLELASGQQLTADQLFSMYYHKAHHLILQTCILNDGNPDWGVRFIDGDASPGAKIDGFI